MTILALCLMFTVGAFIGIACFTWLCLYLVEKESVKNALLLDMHPSGQKDEMPFNVIDLTK